VRVTGKVKTIYTYTHTHARARAHIYIYMYVYKYIYIYIYFQNNILPNHLRRFSRHLTAVSHALYNMYETGRREGFEKQSSQNNAFSIDFLVMIAALGNRARIK